MPFVPLVALVVLYLCSTLAKSAPVLKPYQQLVHEVIALDTETKRYQLEDLLPSHSYEVRVSYPATIPSEIQFSITGSNPTSKNRKLLNLEKIIFQVDHDGRVEGFQHPEVYLRALRAGVHREGPLKGHTHLHYNIVLAEVWSGIPLDALPVVAYGVLLLLAVVVFVPIWIRHLLPRLLDHLTTATGTEGKSS